MTYLDAATQAADIVAGALAAHATELVARCAEDRTNMGAAMETTPLRKGDLIAAVAALDEHVMDHARAVALLAQANALAEALREEQEERANGGGRGYGDDVPF